MHSVGCTIARCNGSFLAFTPVVVCFSKHRFENGPIGCLRGSPFPPLFAIIFEHACVKNKGVRSVYNLLGRVQCVGMGGIIYGILDLFDQEFKGLVGVPWNIHTFVVLDVVGRGDFCVGLVEVIEEVKYGTLCMT